MRSTPMPVLEAPPNFSRARRSLAVSMVVCGAGGAGFIYWWWSSRGVSGAGAIRASIYLGCMAIVHIVGFIRYRQQSTDDRFGTPAADDENTPHLIAQCQRMLRANAIVHFVLMLLASMLLDFGGTLRMLIPAIAGYWAGALLIVFRRRNHPVKSDLDFLRAGTLVTLLIDVGLTTIIVTMRGYWR